MSPSISGAGCEAKKEVEIIRIKQRLEELEKGLSETLSRTCLLVNLYVGAKPECNKDEVDTSEPNGLINKCLSIIEECSDKANKINYELGRL